MKVLLVAPKSDWTFGIKRAFERNGAEVFYFNERTNFLVPWPLRENFWLWQLLIRKFGNLKMKNKERFNREIIKLCRSIRPDILFTIKGTTLRRATLDTLRSMNIKSVNWFIENIHHDLYKKWAQNNYDVFDYFLTFDSTVPTIFPSTPNTKVVYVPLSVESAFYKSEPTKEEIKKYSSDVCFVGALYPEREDMLNAVKDMGVELKIFGWPEWKRSSVSDCYQGALKVRDISKVFKCSKICLNSNLRPAKGSLNVRTFEIPASGAFELCDDQADVHGLFKVGEELDVYNSTEDLCQKIKFYLENDDRRRLIAKAGHEKFIKDHDLNVRIKRIFDIIKS